MSISGEQLGDAEPDLCFDVLDPRILSFLSPDRNQFQAGKMVSLKLNGKLILGTVVDALYRQNLCGSGFWNLENAGQ